MKHATALILLSSLCRLALTAPSLTSIDTGYTITKVRTAVRQGQSRIVASSYEGTVLAIGHDGKRLWRNELSGFMNHDLWCADVTGDGSDEILAANADGSLYCLDSAGRLLWSFRPSEPPMYAVCVVHDAKGVPYVVCGGYDCSLYYLSAAGKLVKALASSNYSVQKPWGSENWRKPRHIANFLRPVRRADGSECLAVHGVMNSMQAGGKLYLMEPLATEPFRVVSDNNRGIGSLHVADADGDGNEEILTGTSGMIFNSTVYVTDPFTGRQRMLPLAPLRPKVDHFGYRVAQAEVIDDGGQTRYLILLGSQAVVVPLDLDAGKAEVLRCGYAFYDLWRDRRTGLLYLAGSQSGGSCVHIIDTRDPGWKQAYAALKPPGKIESILANTAVVRKQLEAFQAPKWERQPATVHIGVGRGLPEHRARLKSQIESRYSSPVFLRDFWEARVEDWDRSAMTSETYRRKRDGRRKYTASQREILEQILPIYNDYAGVSYWGGHGSDPFFYSMDTRKKLLEGAKGKYTALVFPELEDRSAEFQFVMDELMYPLAELCRTRNARIYIRTKNVFWLGTVYEPYWNRLVSGELANVFVPLMEETTDKCMDVTVAGRLGIWASGAVDKLGARCAWDNPSFDRLRQFSYQRLPSHFLRNMVYSLAFGATEINAAQTDYTSLYWELIAKGALYIPKRSEIVSFSPVHLSMRRPDRRFLDEGSNVKWTVFYDAKQEAANPLLFSHLNGSWPAAPVTEWDFSRYAAGVRDRRQNFLPPYENGLVLITPPQNGAFADSDAPRGRLTNHLHPLYRSIMKEFITDGRNYYSADGQKTYAANSGYHRQIEAEIRERAKLLPLTVSGNVAWVCAQTAPKHLRLTLVDGGYLNPSDRVATVSFNTVQPTRIIDLLSTKALALSHPRQVEVPVPCGLFRFLDIEIAEPLMGGEDSRPTRLP